MGYRRVRYKKYILKQHLLAPFTHTSQTKNEFQIFFGLFRKYFWACPVSKLQIVASQVYFQEFFWLASSMWCGSQPNSDHQWLPT